jgi:hypothetical protein
MNSLTSYTDKELITMARELYDALYVTDCYSANDVLRLEAVCEELIDRDYEIYGADGYDALEIIEPDEEI